MNGLFIDPKTGLQYGAVDSTREVGLIGLDKRHDKKDDDDDDD